MSEQIEKADVVMIGKLLEPASRPESKEPTEKVQSAEFEIVQIIKGPESLRERKTVETLFHCEGKSGEIFLLTGHDPVRLAYLSMQSVSAQNYVAQSARIDKKNPRRFIFLLDYLEDADPDVSQDAHEQFAKASRETVRGLKENLPHDRLVTWLQDAKIPAYRRRLYFTLLGICGDAQDLPMVEAMLKSADGTSRWGLSDVMIECYLSLRGPEGISLIEELLIKNRRADYNDIHGAVLALRCDVASLIPKERVRRSLRHVLERPEFVDIVIPDLTRLEDWSVMPRLVDMHKNGVARVRSTRAPVLEYLRACPLPEAKESLKEFEKFASAEESRQREAELRRRGIEAAIDLDEDPFDSKPKRAGGGDAVDLIDDLFGPLPKRAKGDDAANPWLEFADSCRKNVYGSIRWIASPFFGE